MYKFYKLVLLINILSKTFCANTRRPNIILFLADDMGWNDVGFHGNNEVLTPNLDSLAYNGIILNNHYSQTLCTPSRAALLTGKLPIHLGMQHNVLFGNEPRGLPLDEILLPQLLKKEANYSTFMVGKWHLGHFRKEYTPTYRGFDSHFGFWNGFQDYYIHTHFDKFQNMSGYDMRRNMDVDYESFGKYSTDIITDEAVKIIHKQDVNSNPFFFYVAHGAPHTGNPSDPLQAPDDTVNKFQHIKDPFRRKYLAMVYKLDESLGRIFQALRQKKILNNSVIIFLSDNGAQPVYVYANRGSNYPLRGMKYSTWDGGSRTLGVIWSPLLKTKRKVFNKLVHITDWFPTICSIADIKCGENLDGFNIWKSLQSEEAEDHARREILYNIDDIDKYEVIRNERWKYINGNLDNSQYDGWYGKPEKLTPNIYNIDEILNSYISKSLNGFITDQQILQNDILGPIEPNFTMSDNILTSDMIEMIRQNATIICSNVPDENNQKDICNPCLFDLITDPCETKNLANKYPDIINHFRSRIQYWRQNLVAPQNILLDSRGDPKFWNNTWTNWYDLLTIKQENKMNSTILSYVFVLFCFFLLILLLIFKYRQKINTRKFDVNTNMTN